MALVTHPKGSDGWPALLRLSVLGVELDAGSSQAFLDRLCEMSGRHASSYVCFVNVHMLMEANHDPMFLQVVNASDLNCPDGLPVARSVGWFHGLRQSQVSGPDVLPQLVRIAHERGKRIFVLGSTEEVLRKFNQRVLDEFGEGVVVDCYSPPFRRLTEDEDDDLVRRINDAQADMVFVALGCPKQEKWMHAHRGQVKGCMLGLGYAIPVYAGVESRAPRWMIERGLEWAFRLSSDPRRLFKRYLRTNSSFALRVLRARPWRQVRLDPGDTMTMPVVQKL